MHQSISCQFRPSASAITALISGTVFFPDDALANPLTDLVSNLSSSPSLSFGCGCVFGAVVAGLAVGIAARSTKMDLENQLTDMMNAVVRAEGAARRAQAALELYERAGQNKVDPFEYMEPAQGVEPVRIRTHTTRTHATSNAKKMGPVASAQSRTPQQGQVASPSNTGRHFAVGAGGTGANVTAEPSRQNVSAQRTGQGRREERQDTRETLRERLGRTFTGEMPKIERAPVREVERTLGHAAPMARVVSPEGRSFDPSKRASIINRRVPTLDALEEPLQASAPVSAPDPQRTVAFTYDQIAQASQVPQASAGVEDQSHVDDLVREEFENMRKGAGRRFSRSKLKMIDGAADSKGRSKAGPRHMALATKEA